MICLYLKQFINLMSTNHLYFRFPSPPVSIRPLKPVHPTGAHSYTFPTLPSSLWHSALNLEPTLLCGPYSRRLPCGGTCRTVCHETCMSQLVTELEEPLDNHVSNHDIDSWHSGRKGEEETHGLSSGCVTHGCTQYCWLGTTAANCPTPAFFCNALSLCNICLPP